MIPSIGLLGCGRMGQVVNRRLTSDYSNRARLLAMIGSADSVEDIYAADVVIDFASSAAVLKFVESFKENLKKADFKYSKPAPALVVASTGWKPAERAELEKYASHAPVLVSSNFSLGILVLTEILKSASPLLEKLGYMPTIVETHHRHKLDSPSGTALSLQRVISPSGPGNVPIHSIRAGEVIGDHEVRFYGQSDHLAFGHFAQDRSIFARGAIEAALWLAEKRASGNKGILKLEDFIATFIVAGTSV